MPENFPGGCIMICAKLISPLSKSEKKRKTDDGQIEPVRYNNIADDSPVNDTDQKAGNQDGGVKQRNIFQTKAIPEVHEKVTGQQQ